MINSVLKAIDILRLFSREEPRLSLAQVSSRLGLPKSTAHNLLATLLSRGFVEKVDGDRYALGTAIVALTQGVRVNVELRDRAAPLLRELADATRESVYLAVLDGDYCLYIYAVEAPHRLRARTAVGDCAHLHCTGVGKAILSGLPGQEADAIVARTGLPAFTPATITDLTALQQELAHTQERGYSIDRGEHEVGIHCLGAAILDERGRVVGACSISSADPALIGQHLEQHASRVGHVAEEISRRMGYVPTAPRFLATASARRSRALASVPGSSALQQDRIPSVGVPSHQTEGATLSGCRGSVAIGIRAREVAVNKGSS